MMKTKLGWLILMPLIYALPGIAKSADEMKAVKAASDAFYEALATLDDGTAMANVWAHEPYITFVGPRSKAVIAGWDAVKAYWAKSNPKFVARTVSLSERHIHVVGDLAWEMGRQTGAIVMADGTERQADLLVTNIYERKGERWVMVSHHAQPAPQ